LWKHKRTLFLQRLPRSASGSPFHCWHPSIFGCWPSDMEQSMWAEREQSKNGAEGPMTDLCGAERWAGFKKSSGAWAEREREVLGTGKICRSKSAPP